MKSLWIAFLILSLSTSIRSNNKKKRRSKKSIDLTNSWGSKFVSDKQKKTNTLYSAVKNKDPKKDLRLTDNRENSNPIDRSSEKSERDDGIFIVIDAENFQNKTSNRNFIPAWKDSSFTKRDEVFDVKNKSSQGVVAPQNDIYDQLKNRFEKIEKNLATITKLSAIEEPPVRVIVITPKSFNVSNDNNLNILDLEKSGALSKDNVYVTEMSNKDIDDTLANALKKREKSEGSGESRELKDESGKESSKDGQLISPLLADKDALNEVVREINLLKNYSKSTENISDSLENNIVAKDEKSDAMNLLDDVLVMGKSDDEHNHSEDSAKSEAASHEVRPYEGAGTDRENIHKVENKDKDYKNFNENKENLLGLQVKHIRNNNSLKGDNGTSHKNMPPMNPGPKSSNLNIPFHEPTKSPVTTKYDETNKNTNREAHAQHIAKKVTSNTSSEISKQIKTSLPTTKEKANNDTKEKKPETARKKIINKSKAEAIIEFLNKDPLEVWRYAYKSLHALDLNSTLLRSGLVNAGNIERLKGVMRRALEGRSVTISVVGGSISAGGGLYKDQKSISGLYYKGLIDWWEKMITPLTGSYMIVNNVAIGSIGTDYFSFCVKNHIVNESDIVLWELSANDYNRYKMQPTKGARPLERFTRMILELPNRPALLYINFFKGIDFKATRESCPDFEDQGEDIIAHYYKIPSLSWRAMVCDGLVNKQEHFTIETLFSLDEYHPSIRGHAQMSLLILLHLRHVMRAVLQWAISHDGYLEKFEDRYVIPEPLFMGPKYPEPLCWSLISPDQNQKLWNSLFVRVKTNDGFKLEYATNFPIRFDKVVCWKAEKPQAEIALQFYIPDDYGSTGLKRDRSEVAITTHTRWGGSSSLWIDGKTDRTIVIKEGREHDPGKRTQVDSLAKDVPPGYHTLHVRAHEAGFCLAAIMVDSS